MSLNLNSQPAQNASKNFDRPLAKAGVQPARVAEVIELGLQARPAFKGKEKSPARQVIVNHELVTDTYEVEGKKYNQRIALKPFNIVSRKSEMYGNSAIAGYLTSVDPKDNTKGDLAALANLPCLATVVHVDGMGKHAGKKFANITTVMQPPEGYPVPPLNEPATVFSWDNPTPEAWALIPTFIQEKIKTALDYKGSKVEAMVNAIVAETK